MAAAKPRTQDQVRKDIEAEREHLAGAVEHLRGELGQVANLRGKLTSKLPLAAGTAASAGFVLAGGVGATMRYFARRGREGHEKARLGRWSLRDRD
jgi:shikimate kinase